MSSILSTGHPTGTFGTKIKATPKLKPQQRLEIVRLVTKGKKTAADAARLFGVHPATVSRLLRQNLAA